ncbi:MAG: sulfotransferase domain-containing protein [Vicingus serpentipes]|nr:sulfotransferase domain-containing protein [Vicingus serpentipes]
MRLEHIIIGAGRSGTTSLVEYLKQHRQVNFSKIKEVTYFSVNDHYSRGTAFLHDFFEDKEGVKMTSDTYLLMDKNAPKRIVDYNPAMKIAVILREPSERTYSNYHYLVNQGYIDKEVRLIDSEMLESEILDKGDIIDQNNLCNFYGSLYYLHLSNWLNYFKREQLFICTTEQLRDNPQQLMDNYFKFLGLDKIQVAELSAQNSAAGVKNKKLNQFLVNREHPIRKLISKPLQISFLRNIILNSNVVEKIKLSNKREQQYVPMTEEEKNFCANYFAKDMQQLKKEFGVDFSNEA